jgi:hypothetical protein
MSMIDGMDEGEVASMQPSAMGGVASGLPREDHHMRVSITGGRLEVSANLSDENDIDELIRILSVTKALFRD